MSGLAVEEGLIQGCRVLADDGQGDLIWGHVSVRHPDCSDRIHMKPAGLGLEEIARADLVVVDLDGEKIEGTSAVHVEVFIHTEVMRSRPDVNAVVHTHPMHAVAFSSLGQPLLPVGHEGALFCEGLPVFTDTSDLIVDPALGRSVAARLGNSNAIILRNHGIVTAGRTVEEAVMTAVMLEKACKVQLLAAAAGEIKAFTDVEEARAKRDRVYTPKSLELAFQYCLRRADARRCRCHAQPGMSCEGVLA